MRKVEQQPSAVVNASPAGLARYALIGTQLTGTPQPFAISVQDDGADAIVRVTGEIDMESSPTLKSRLIELAQAGYRRVTVDMTETAFIDSTGLHALVVAVKELGTHGGKLVVRSPSKSAARLLELTGFDTLVEVI